MDPRISTKEESFHEAKKAKGLSIDEVLDLSWAHYLRYLDSVLAEFLTSD